MPTLLANSSCRYSLRTACSDGGRLAMTAGKQWAKADREREPVAIHCDIAEREWETITRLTISCSCRKRFFKKRNNESLGWVPGRRDLSGYVLRGPPTSYSSGRRTFQVKQNALQSNLSTWEPRSPELFAHRSRRGDIMPQRTRRTLPRHLQKLRMSQYSLPWSCQLTRSFTSSSISHGWNSPSQLSTTWIL